jgi:hypothetical protein
LYLGVVFANLYFSGKSYQAAGKNLEVLDAFLGTDVVCMSFDVPLQHLGPFLVHEVGINQARCKLPIAKVELCKGHCLLLKTIVKLALG